MVLVLKNEQIEGLVPMPEEIEAIEEAATPVKWKHFIKIDADYFKNKKA